MWRNKLLVSVSVIGFSLIPITSQAATNFVSPVQSFTCTNQVTTALAQGTGAFTCSSLTAAYFATGTQGQVLNSPSSTTYSFTAAPTLGVASTTNGTLELFSSATANGIIITNQGATSGYNFNLPLTAGSANQAMVSQGGGSSAMTWASIVSAKFTTASKTTNYNVATTTDDWTRFDNTGAGGTVTFTVPTAANTSAGDNWCFTEVANQTVSIAVNSTQTITIGNVAGTTGTGTLQSGGVGSSVCIYATSTTNLVAWASNGAWTNN